jgi:hypothetical protein
MILSVQISNVLRINCSYNLWIVNKFNYQSEPRLQELKIDTTDVRTWLRT